jgi:hypothetical protein
MVTRIKYAAVLGALGVFMLAGCGSHGGKAAASSSPDSRDMAVKFAQCMRQHGVNVADPKPGDPGVRITGKNLSDAKAQAASQACAKYRALGQLNPNDPKVRDALLKTAQCLRQHGLQVTDPQPGQGLKLQMKRGDTKTQQAVEACQKLVPRPGAPTKPANGG